MAREANVYSINPEVNGSFNNQASDKVEGAVTVAESPEPKKPDPSMVEIAVFPPYTGLEVADTGVIKTLIPQS